MVIKAELEVIPFSVPLTVQIRMPAVPRQEGFKPAPGINLKDLDDKVLDHLLEKFKENVLQIAGRRN